MNVHSIIIGTVCDNLFLANNIANQQNGEIMMQKKVTFKNNEHEMAGILFFPDDFDETQQYAAFPVASPAGAVKEQIATNYGSRLAKYGFIALAFDTSHQGESGGTPRQLEAPYERVEDIKCAIDYLTTLPYVDNERIGQFGVCAGAGYSMHTAMTDRRIKAVAVASMSDPASWIRDGFDGQTPVETQLALLEEASNQRTREANGADPIYGTFVPEEVTAGMPNTLEEAHEYYRTPRGQHPRSTNQVSMMSIDKMTDFSTFMFADKYLTQPILMIAGTNADTLRFSEDLLEKAASKNKELFTIEGATHVDLYDKPEYVDQAVAKAAAFFKANL